jgi:hypothetical protein
MVLLIGLWMPAQVHASCGDYLTHASHSSDIAASAPSGLHHSALPSAAHKPTDSGCHGPNCSGKRHVPVSPPVTVPTTSSEHACLTVQTFVFDLNSGLPFNPASRLHLNKNADRLERPPRSFCGARA